MIKRNNKKGFTIVELVIVIAVIAILAAVLIPTFSGIVKKAQLSSDQQAVRNMNIALAASGDLTTMNAVIDALAENGFNSEKALIPVSKGYKFMWSAAANCIVLLDETGAVVYPADIEYANDGVDLGESLVYLDVAAKDADSLSAALSAGSQDIKLEDNLTLKTEVTIPAGKKVTLDLNNKKLSTEKTGERSKYLNVEGELTIVNGTIDARGIQIYEGAKLVIGKDAKVVVNNVDSNGGAALWVYKGGNVEINGGTFTAVAGDKAKDGDDLQYEPGVINNSGTVTINDGVFTAENTGCYAINNCGTLVINGGTFTAWRGVVATTVNAEQNLTGNTTINGGTFTVTDTTAGGHVVYASGANVVVNITGGTFSSDDFSSEKDAVINDNRNK